MSETVKFEAWLALRKSQYGYRPGTMRLTKTKPTLKPGEIPLKISLSVPLAVFETPTFHIVAEVAEGATLQSEIPVDVQENLTAIIREQTGLVVEISLPEEPEAD